MYIRCLDCQSSNWIESVDPGSTVRGVSCRTCGRDYTLEVPEDLGATQRDQYQKALRFAESHGIDLPAAYSVLLGIMSVDEARGLREKAVSRTTKAAAARVAARKSRPAAVVSPLEELRRQKTLARRTEPGSNLRPAAGPPPGQGVAADTPAASGAAERSRLRLLASRLVRTHGFSRRLAYEVAAGRITLQAALQRQVERKASAAAGPRPFRLTPRQRAWITGIASVAFMLLAVNGVCLWHGYAEEAEAAKGLTDAVARQASTTPPPPPVERAEPDRAEEATSVRTDEAGRVLAVAGPNPRDVLIRFCEAASTTTRLEPLELTSAVPPFPGTRLGLFRELGKPETKMAIRIRRDHDSHRWIAGDGSRPIVAFQPPPLPAEAQRIDVANR